MRPNGLKARTNGPVVLGHDLTIRLDRVHHERLKWVTRMVGRTSPTVEATALLSWAIDEQVKLACADIVGHVLTRVLTG